MKKGKKIRKVARKPKAAPKQTALAVLPKRDAMTEATALRAFDMLGITTKLEPQQKLLFIEMAVMNNLNPLKREIHAVERKQKQPDLTWKTVLTPVTGYEVFIDRAEESGRLQYWHIESTGTVKDQTLQSTVTIKRKDWPVEFKWTCRWVEVSVANPMWEKEPTHMTEKVTLSRGFRLCFRDVLRGMPFTVEEEQSREEPIDVTPLAEPKALEAPKYLGPPKAEDKEKVEAILLARSELQQVFKKLVLSGLFEKKELEAMKEAATIMKEDLGALRNLLTQWQIMASEREEKGGAA